MEGLSPHSDIERRPLSVVLCRHNVLNVQVTVIAALALFKVVYMVSSFKSYKRRGLRMKKNTEKVSWLQTGPDAP